MVTAGNAPISSAFLASDNVLAQSVETVINLILLPAVINLDFADVKSTLENSGVGMIGFGVGQGPNRAKEAANNALNSPLLEASITGARRAIVAVTCGRDVSLFDAQDCVNLLINASGHDIDLKFGVSINDQLNDEILVSVIASDFEEDVDFTHSGDTFIPKREDALFVTPDMPKSENSQPEVKQPSAEASAVSVDDEDILPNFLKD